MPTLLPSRLRREIPFGWVWIGSLLAGWLVAIVIGMLVWRLLMVLS